MVVTGESHNYEEMRGNIIVIGLLFILEGCSSKTCMVDKKFVFDYNRRLQVIEGQEKGEVVGADDYRNTVLYFYKITGVLLKADYSSTIGYSDKFVYNKDIAKLHDWLGNNKCSYSKTKEDSILRTSGYSYLITQ